MAIEQPVQVFIGEDKNLVVTIQGADSAAEDITGWSLSWMVKKRLADSDEDAVLTKTVGSGITLTAPASGICTIALEDIDTDPLAARVYRHELKRMDAGQEAVIVYGELRLSRGVHRS